MRTIKSPALAPSIETAATDCREPFAAVGSGNILPPKGWFMHIAHGMWPDKPAAWLRSFTGFPERTCRSAASGDTEVSGAMLYALLRSDAGGDILARIMDGAGADWYRSLHKYARAGRCAVAEYDRTA